MILKKLLLKNFRNYDFAEVEFSPYTNLIYGANAQGKTNLLEAIYLLITGRSFRTPHLIDLIQKGRKDFRVEAHFEKLGVPQTLKLFYNGTHRVVKHNATTYPALSNLLGVLQGVILSPDDYQLIKGSPSLRRRFLDIQIAQTDSAYIEHLGRYIQAMHHRNTILKTGQIESIEIWEMHMATAAAYVIAKRREAVVSLNEKIGHIRDNLMRIPDHISLSYKNSAPLNVPLKDYYIERYAQIRPREVDMGHTLSGPHKDDLDICINELDAHLFASEGQQRSCVAILRLAEWQRLQDLTESSPFLSVDDIGLSLDPKRKSQLLEALTALPAQLFLTAPELLSSMPAAAKPSFYHIEAGKILTL
ncbi:MAG: replication and repair protein RecF [Chlamydiales bacterium]|jgi:DNA replication and repair protein RecF|nr:replication and repair protein RecF [Chlamydiales bacterium]